MTNTTIYRLSRAVYVLNRKYSVERFKVIMAEFESQSFFFFLAYLFVLRENLNFTCFTRRLFFCLVRAQFICKRIYFIRRELNTIPMQCSMQKRSIAFANRRRKMGWQYHWPRQRKTLQPMFVVGKSTIERLMMKRDQTKEEKPELSGTKEGPTGRLWSTLSMFCQ